MSIKPNQLGLMMHPVTGAVAVVSKKPRDTVMLRDVTTDFVLMQVAEILNSDDPEAEGVAREHVVTGPTGSRLTVEITCRILKREQLQTTSA